LKEIYFWGVELSDESVVQMSQALETAGPERHLRSLSLRHCGPNLTERGYSAIVRMLQRNYRLQKVQLDRSVPVSIQEQINFYLHLNQSGTRGHLLENTNLSKEEWTNGLAHHSNDIGALHYFLQESGSALWS
jgi:hypothetical protein